MGQLVLSQPMSIKDCLTIALDVEQKNGNLPDDIISLDQVVETITSLLVSRAEMLLEYYSLEISKDGNLIALPMLIKDYVPNMDKLPLFLLRLGTEVDWESEKDCFRTLSRELATFYSADDNKEDYLWKIQHRIFPCFKTYFAAPVNLKEYVTPLANLADLYKIFERC